MLHLFKNLKVKKQNFADFDKLSNGELLALKGGTGENPPEESETKQSNGI